ncbi:MAG: tetratricopeptide repeat protein [Prevotellaceae bacterium]|nr:tetratricopeptide repeat protein [Prevotellaceae bacterium]
MQAIVMLNTKTQQDKNFALSPLRAFVLLALCLFVILPSFGKQKPVAVSQKQETAIRAEEKRKFDYYFLEALRQKMRGNRDAAADNLLRCYYIDPENATVFSELANLNISAGHIPLAKKYMIEAVRLEPENFWMKQALVQLYLQNKEYRQAAEVSEEILKKHPEKKEYYYILASLYAQMQQPQKAIQALDSFEERNGTNEQVALEKFKLYISAKNQKKAFNEIDKLIKAFPKQTKYQTLKGDLYLVLDNEMEAEKTYRSVLANYPDEPLATNQLGLLYIRQGKTAEGLALLSSVLQDKATDYELKKSILSFISQDSILATAVNDTIYLNVIKSYPEEELSYLIYAAYLLDQNKEEGIGYIRKALEINPKYEDSWLMLVNYYSMKNDTAGMLNATREAVEHFPENPEFYYAMGTAARLKKEPETALWAWRKAIALQKERNNLLSSAIQGQIGDLYMENHQRQEAFLAYDTALVYNENNILVLNNYAYFLSLGDENLSKAERMSGKAVAADPKNPAYLDTYAWIYFKQGDYLLAQMYIEQAFANGGNNDPDVLEHYGDILYKTENREKARKMWQAAWEMKKESEKENSILKKKAETGEYVEK